jgi:septum formation protein
MSTAPGLILASTSTYRAALLRRIFGRFECMAPDVIERPAQHESPAATASRLAQAKAQAVAARHPGAVVIGSDQVTELDGRVLGKPGSASAMREQLQASSGRMAIFHTAVCVIGPDGSEYREIDLTRVRFRALSSNEIDRYVEREPSFDCAGGFKAEALGIVLFEEIESRDPTALIGLPLIATCRLLRLAGLDPLA